MTSCFPLDFSSVTPFAVPRVQGLLLAERRVNLVLLLSFNVYIFSKRKELLQAICLRLKKIGFYSYFSISILFQSALR